jgi:ElaB/YqjD/DUF883 family membrane-anchored ribosome-binding protein
MLDSLDTMISLGVIFLVLSMVLKYVMDMVKKLLRTKASVAAKEMKIFIGENTSEFLELYVRKHARHLNLIHKTNLFNNKTGFRLLNKEELKVVALELRTFMKGKDKDAIRAEFDLSEDSKLLKNIDVVKNHLEALQTKAETIFDNTLRKINETYKKKIQIWTFIAAFLIAGLMNASFFDIYESVSSNPLIKEHLLSNTHNIMTDMDQVQKNISRFAASDVKDIKEEIKNAKQEIHLLIESVPDRHQLFGWKKDEFCSTIKITKNFNKTFNKLIGFFISALLIGFGAPFWHDYLESFINIRKTLAKGPG